MGGLLFWLSLFCFGAKPETVAEVESGFFRCTRDGDAEGTGKGVYQELLPTAADRFLDVQPGTV